MKNKQLTLLLLSFLVLTLANVQILAQSAVTSATVKPKAAASGKTETTNANTAAVNSSWLITLNPKADTRLPIYISVASMKFKDSETATLYFNAVSDNLVSFSYEVATARARFTLNTYPGMATKTLADWNAYLATKAPHLKEVFDQVNK